MGFREHHLYLKKEIKNIIQTINKENGFDEDENSLANKKKFYVLMVISYVFTIIRNCLLVVIIGLIMVLVQYISGGSTMTERGIEIIGVDKFFILWLIFSILTMVLYYILKISINIIVELIRFVIKYIYSNGKHL